MSGAVRTWRLDGRSVDIHDVQPSQMHAEIVTVARSAATATATISVAAAATAGLRSASIGSPTQESTF